MGRYVLVEYSLIRQLCQDFKRENKTFTGRLKDFENEGTSSKSDKIAETRRLLLSADCADKAQYSKRKREREKQPKPKRFRQSEPSNDNEEFEESEDSDSASGSDSYESNTSSDSSRGGSSDEESEEDF